MWDEKCLIKVSKCSKISLYWIFYTKNRIFLHGKTLVFRLFYLLTYKKDKYIIIKKMFYISNKTFFAKKKICFAIFVIQMKKRERNKETKKQRNKETKKQRNKETKKQKRSPSLRWGPTEEKEIQMQHTGL